MSVDPETLACYERKAEEYVDTISRSDPDGDLLAFMDALPDGGAPVLDWGCGPGNSAAIMLSRHIVVEATDASAKMADIAGELGVTVQVETFEDLAPGPRYRGVWANFALLHAAPDAVPRLIARAADTLLHQGILHLGMKRGTGTARDTIGRFFSYWEPEDLDRMTRAAGLTPFRTRLGEGNGLDGRIEPFVIHHSRKSG